MGKEAVCGQTMTELIDFIGFPESFDKYIETARGWICAAAAIPHDLDVDE